jgi:hypothetical protein
MAEIHKICYTFENATLPDNIENVEELMNLSQFDFWRKFFSDEMVDLIKEQTEWYARLDKLTSTFTLTRTELMHSLELYYYQDIIDFRK